MLAPFRSTFHHLASAATRHPRVAVGGSGLGLIVLVLLAALLLLQRAEA